MCSSLNFVRAEPEKEVSLTNFGIAYTTEANRLNFHCGYRTVIIQRLHSTPISNIPLTMIKNSLKSKSCQYMSSDESIANNLSRFTHYLRKEWLAKINELISYKAQKDILENSKESILAEAILEKSRAKRQILKTDRDYNTTDWKPLNSRSRREIATIITAVSALGSLISNAVSIGVAINNEVKYRDFEARNRHILKRFQGNSENYASLSSIISDDLHKISESLCAHTKSEHLRATKELVNNIISDYILSIETEILELNNGRIPSKIEFYKLLQGVCEDSKNSETFCRNVINRGLIKLSWVNTYITGDKDLLSRIEMKIPIESTQFNTDTDLISVSNTGFFSENGSYMKFEIPEHSLLTNKKIFSIRLDGCINNVCSVNDIFSDINTLCLESLLQNKTLGCAVTDFGQKPQICAFSNFGHATIITASTAVFSSVGKDTYKSKVFANNSLVIATP